MTWSENSGSSKNISFSPIQKNNKWIPNNINFDMKIREQFGSIISDLKLTIERKAHNALVLYKAP
jgi:hypothetical protein